MSKFKFFKISTTKKLRYLSQDTTSDLFVVFLHGFMSNLEGRKPKAFLNYCRSKKIGFVALEYSGHGKSSGNFTSGNISKWSKESEILINKIVKRKKIILIGSSMGSWISLNLFNKFKKQIFGFLGIGSAPEFLDKLMWKKFTKKMRTEIKKNGLYNLKHGSYIYPISYQLIKDGNKNKVLNKSIYFKTYVTMVHGSKDKSVPVLYSKKVLKIFKKGFKKIRIIKNGNHSLSSKKNIKILINELDKLVKLYFNWQNL